MAEKRFTEPMELTGEEKNFLRKICKRLNQQELIILIRTYPYLTDHFLRCFNADSVKIIKEKVAEKEVIFSEYKEEVEPARVKMLKIANEEFEKLKK